LHTEPGLVACRFGQLIFPVHISRLEIHGIAAGEPIQRARFAYNPPLLFDG